MKLGRDSERIDLKTLYLLLTGHELFSDFAGNAINSIYIADKQGSTLWVSSGCEQLWGYTAAYLHGKNVVDLERKGVWKPSGVRKVLEARKRVRLMQETGVGRRLHIVGNPIFNCDGELSRVINGALDVSAPPEKIGEEGCFFQSRSSAMREVNRLIGKVAPLDITVLITGESGTGKELAARQIHRLRSPDKPFVKIDCGALTGNLLESELFGYDSGAFSGADRSGKKGLIETASAGTLFLDEIGEIPLSLQNKFLRLIQDKTYFKVGGTREHAVEARIIAATHRNLKNMVENREFRMDLYFRLDTLPIHLPPLRERKQDIPDLVEFFRGRFKLRFGYTRQFNRQALDCLHKYPWPGNIRELKNIVERMILTAEQHTIDACDLPVPFSEESCGQPVELDDVMPLKDCLRLTEENLLHLAWRKYGTTTNVAKALGIDQSTASRKLRKLLQPMR
jgi:transcriptional regulator with PAS, ATPase and Fis domain